MAQQGLIIHLSREPASQLSSGAQYISPVEYGDQGRDDNPETGIKLPRAKPRRGETARKLISSGDEELRNMAACSQLTVSFSPRQWLHTSLIPPVQQT